MVRYSEVFPGVALTRSEHRAHRRQSRYEHAWEIRDAYGYREFPAAEDEVRAFVTPQVFGELGQGEPRGGDAIARGVGARVAGPQQRGHRLSGPGLAVVD